MASFVYLSSALFLQSLSLPVRKRRVSGAFLSPDKGGMEQTAKNKRGRARIIGPSPCVSLGRQRFVDGVPGFGVGLGLGEQFFGLFRELPFQARETHLARQIFLEIGGGVL